MSEMERQKTLQQVPIHSESRKIMLSLYLGFMFIFKPIWVFKKILSERKRVK